MTTSKKRYTLHCKDCLDHMKTMADSSVDAIITDPPYYKVKGDAWDNQWKSESFFLAWVAELLLEFERILKPNGSLYFFASSRMAAKVEMEIRKQFNVLNHITWRKAHNGKESQHMGYKTRKEALRAFFPTAEKILFAEHYNSDNQAKGMPGFTAKCDALRGFLFEPLRAYIAGERDKAGFTTQMVAEYFQKKTGSRTVTGMAGHWFSKSQWALPTEENYYWLRSVFNSSGGDYLNREYKYLKREYEDLRREYEDLKREYEDLRRPFTVTANDQWGDIWEFKPISSGKGKHPCEKPLPLLRHMLNASTKPNAIVFDPFAGSGSTGVACIKTNRQFIGCEINPEYVAIAEQRIANETGQQELGLPVAAEGYESQRYRK